MDLEEIGVNAGNWVIILSPCECGIEPPGSISHGVSNKDSYSTYLQIRTVYLQMIMTHSVCLDSVMVITQCYIMELLHFNLIPSLSLSDCGQGDQIYLINWD